MKHSGFHRAIVAIAMMLIGWLPTLAHDFEVNGIYYDKINSSKVAVTYKGDTWDSYSNEYIGNVVIPTSVKYNGVTYSVISIGDEAFRGCLILTSIQILNSVTSIGNKAFYWCSSLISIVVDTGNTKYDSRNRCNAIIETASNTLITGCQNTIIPNSVTSIGSYAFYYCLSLTSIEIPNSVTSIGEGAFSGCTSLTSIVVDAGNTKYDSRNECNAIIETASNTLIAGCQNTIIPNSVTSIGNDAFYECYSLTSIEIPNSVTSIGWNAFYWCYNLTSIEIPNSVTSIGDEAFSGCSSLTNIEIPNSVTSIGNRAFLNCSSMTSVEIGNSVTSIGEFAFICCDRLTKITCLATTPPTIESSTFSNYSAELYVPAGYKAAYQSAYYWKNFNIKEIVILSTSIALNHTTATLKATETLTLVATILPENATDKSVTWKSSNEAVATVDANGLVAAIAVGEATITATTADGSNLSASCKVTVVPTLAETITFDKTEISLEATETTTLVATVLPELTTNKSVTWTSSNEAVATVDANGKVTAVAVGEAIITATTTDGSNLSASCKVVVKPTLATSITLNHTEASVEEKSDFQLTATILPEHATNKEVAWSSSDKWVASVDNTGLVTMYSAGEVIITATTTDGTNLSATCRINVYSGIDGVEGDDVIVATIGDNIVVKNAKLGSNVRVYAADGSIISSEVATDGDVVVEAPIKGVYIVSVNGKTFKVMVK